MAKKIICGLTKSFLTDDGHTSEFWVLSDFNYPYSEKSETNFNKPRLWKQVLLLYKDVNSLINNKLSTGVRKVVYIPFWASNVNDANWGNILVDMIKSIDPFFSDSVKFEYEIDEINDEPFISENKIIFSDSQIFDYPTFTEEITEVAINGWNFKNDGTFTKI